MPTKTLARHYNSQNEKITIDRILKGGYKGQLLLIIHDDHQPEGSGVKAPMLLDQSTIDWLVEQLSNGMKFPLAVEDTTDV